MNTTSSSTDRQVLHELPRILARTQALIHEDGQFVGRLGPEKLETGPSLRGLVVRRHPSSVRVPARVSARRAPTLTA